LLTVAPHTQLPTEWGLMSPITDTALVQRLEDIRCDACDDCSSYVNAAIDILRSGGSIYEILAYLMDAAVRACRPLLRAQIAHLLDEISSSPVLLHESVRPATVTESEFNTLFLLTKAVVTLESLKDVVLSPRATSAPPCHLSSCAGKSTTPH